MTLEQDLQSLAKDIPDAEWDAFNKGENMDKLARVLAKYWEKIPDDQVGIVAEVLDAFLDDYRIVGWDHPEKVGYGE